MYAINKAIANSSDIFIRFPPGPNAVRVGNKRVDTPLKAWLMEHAADHGYMDGRVVGVYLREEDAIVFKLRFGQ